MNENEHPFSSIFEIHDDERSLSFGLHLAVLGKPLINCYEHDPMGTTADDTVEIIGYRTIPKLNQSACVLLRVTIGS